MSRFTIKNIQIKFISTRAILNVYAPAGRADKPFWMVYQHVQLGHTHGKWEELDGIGNLRKAL